MMRPALPSIGTALAVLHAAPPLLAQSAPAEGSQVTSYFRMFFIVGGDLFGQLQVFFLILLSVFAVAYMIKMFIDFRRSAIVPQALFDQVRQLMEERRYREAIDLTSGDPTYLAKLVSGAMNEAPNGYSAMERTMEEVSDIETSRMLRPIEYLNVVGNIAPMIGLFGTVYGMIVAFQQLVSSGGRADPASLAGGISTALVTTFWGLIIAIPSLAAYALVRNKVDALSAEGLLMVEDLLRPFRPTRRGARRGAAEEPGGRPQATPKPEL